MKRLWVLHGAEQIHFKDDITVTLREKAMMKERK